MKVIKAGVLGSTGYAGQQLSAMLSRHRQVDIVFLSSNNYSNSKFSDVYGNYKGFIDNLCIDMQSAMHKLAEIDVLFLALPHGQSFEIVEKALSLGVKVIDIGSDYRLKDVKNFENWYGVKHLLADVLPQSVYGLPELYRNKIKAASLIANPGCYPTASTLAVAPLFKLGLIDKTDLIIDAKSGVSGAGRSASIPSLFCECSESVKAYGVTSHRHTPEIEQTLGDLAGEPVIISFTPHLIPMNRGILATCYAKLKDTVSQAELYEAYREFYQGEPFIRIIDSLPETRFVANSNLCDIALRVDQRTGRIIVLSAIDNLVKGAAGQAVQNMNILFEIEETEGINMIPTIP